MTENSDKLDNMTVRRFAKLIKGNSTNNGSTGITTGTVIQNDNQLFVAVDDETLVPVSDTASNVNVGDKVTLAIDNEEALIVGNNSDASPTASELSETDTKATFAKVDASEAKDTAQTAQVTANTAQNTAETAQTTADNAQSTATEAQTTAQSAQDTATEAKETADAVDGKATEAKETATQAQATATTASETATQAQTTANTAKETADTASTKADNAQSTADTASSKADNAQTTADTASSKADTAQETADNASKVATNYIDFDETNGLVIGDKREGATLTANTQINSEGVHIRDGETVLASFTDNKISLGNNNQSAEIKLCNDAGKIAVSTDSDSKFLSITSNLDALCIQQKSSQSQEGGGWSNYNSFMKFAGSNFSWLGSFITSSSWGEMTMRIMNMLSYDGNGLKITEQDKTNHIPPYLLITSLKEDGYIKADILYQGDDKVSVEGHTHVKDDITDFAHTHTKSDITDFSHTHTKSEISDFAHDHTDEDLYPYSVHAKNDIRVHDTVVSLNGHNHAGDALTPATINTTSTIKQNGTQVSLEGHTHEADDLTTSTPILKVVTSTSSSVTASKQSLFALNCPIPTVAGYTLVGCVSWTTNQAATLMRRSYKSSSNWTLLMYNVSTTSITVTGTVQLLFAKEGWV